VLCSVRARCLWLPPCQLPCSATCPLPGGHKPCQFPRLSLTTHFDSCCCFYTQQCLLNIHVVVWWQISTGGGGKQRPVNFTFLYSIWSRHLYKTTWHCKYVLCVLCVCTVCAVSMCCMYCNYGVRGQMKCLYTEYTCKYHRKLYKYTQ